MFFFVFCVGMNVVSMVEEYIVCVSVNIFVYVWLNRE